MYAATLEPKRILTYKEAEKETSHLTKDTVLPAINVELNLVIQSIRALDSAIGYNVPKLLTLLKLLTMHSVAIFHFYNYPALYLVGQMFTEPCYGAKLFEKLRDSNIYLNPMTIQVGVLLKHLEEISTRDDWEILFINYYRILCGISGDDAYGYVLEPQRCGVKNFYWHVLGLYILYKYLKINFDDFPAEIIMD